MTAAAGTQAALPAATANATRQKPAATSSAAPTAPAIRSRNAACPARYSATPPQSASRAGPGSGPDACATAVARAGGEDDDPGDDRQMQVAVAVGRGQDRVGVAREPLLGASAAARSKYVHHSPTVVSSASVTTTIVRAPRRSPAPSPIAMIDSPRQMITNSP